MSQSLGTGCGIFFCLSVGNLGNRSDLNKRSSRESESTRRALRGVSFQTDL